MRKKLSIVLISSLALLLSTGCSSTKADAAKQDIVGAHASEKSMENSFSTDITSAPKASKFVKEIGEKNGWKMTEFKSNEIFAEKKEGAKTIFTSIKYVDGLLIFSNPSEAKSLLDAIKEELANKKSSH